MHGTVWELNGAWRVAAGVMNQCIGLHPAVYCIDGHSGLHFPID
jgi:hypothetical protein